MFGLSKILGFFALPSNLLLALALAGILLMRDAVRRFGQGLLSARCCCSRSSASRRSAMR